MIEVMKSEEESGVRKKVTCAVQSIRTNTGIFIFIVGNTLFLFLEKYSLPRVSQRKARQQAGI